MNNFVGTWNTSWTGGTPGVSQLTIRADGTASYNTGTTSGAFAVGNLVYSGTWKDNSGMTGGFAFVLVGTDTFIGVWSNGGEGQWNGTINNR